MDQKDILTVIDLTSDSETEPEPRATRSQTRKRNRKISVEGDRLNTPQIEDPSSSVQATNVEVQGPSSSKIPCLVSTTKILVPAEYKCLSGKEDSLVDINDASGGVSEV